jgi:ABC-type glycerol-3-phosphate transport system substrate-binding protein
MISASCRPKAPSRPFTRRTSLSGTMTAAGALLLAACDLPGTDSAAGMPKAPVPLEFWGGPNEASRRDQVAAWNAANPRVQVQFHAVPAVGQGTQALRTLLAAMAAHAAPDLLDFDRFQIASCTNWRVFRTVDDLLKRDHHDLARFVPVALEEAYGFDGHLYGLPSSVDNRLLFWSKARFGEAGLDPEVAPASWDSLVEAAGRLSTGDGAASRDRLGLDVGEGQGTLHLFCLAERRRISVPG